MKTRTLILVFLIMVVLIIAGSCATKSQRLRRSAGDGDYAEVKRLIEEGADVNAQDKDLGWNALGEASREGHIEIVELLIEEGADVNVNAYGTALMFASQYGHIDIVRLLIEAGADVNSRGYYGYTALMFSRGLWIISEEPLHEGYPEIEKLLIDAGAIEY